MIKIMLTLDKIEDEPGPNFYWRGECTDFMNLVNDLHHLGTHRDVEVNLCELDYIKIVDNYCVIAISSIDGRSLVEIDKNKINIKCDCDIWREILQYFLSISFYPSHNYVEIEGNNIIEQANFIISSEG